MRSTRYFVDHYVPTEIEAYVLSGLYLNDIPIQARPSTALSGRNTALYWLFLEKNFIPLNFENGENERFQKGLASLAKKVAEAGFQELFSIPRLSFNFFHAVSTRLMSIFPSVEAQETVMTWLYRYSDKQEILRQMLWHQSYNKSFNNDNLPTFVCNPNASPEMFVEYFQHVAQLERAASGKPNVSYYLDQTIQLMPEVFVNDALIETIVEYGYHEVLTDSKFVPYFRAKHQLDDSLPDSWVKQFAVNVYKLHTNDDAEKSVSF